MKVRKHQGASCLSTSTTTVNLLLSFLALSAIPASASQQSPRKSALPLANLAALPPIGPDLPSIPKSSSHDFTLRHIFHRGVYEYPDLHRRLDLYPASTPLAEDGETQISRRDHYIAKSRTIEIERLTDRSQEAIESHLKTARLTGQPAALDASAWTVDELPGPDVRDKDTVVTLARMAANAYVDIPHQGEWEEVDDFNRSAGFGWEEDGLRGYVFADETNSTVVVGLKGTSPAVFDGSETTTNDKLNDNLFFSCCCGQGGQYLWRQVCDCQSSTYTCNQTCLIQELRAENRYYKSSIELFTNISQLYPDSNIWLTGHSLGGAVSALLGHTFGLPVVAFEAPGDDLPAKRLGLPAPPDADPQHPRARSKTGVHHFGHTADPVFMGSCNTAAATCTFGGYAMESQCHTGHVCLYDTVSDLGWRVGIGNHKIHVVINSVILAYDTLPTCESDDECVDCFNWKFYESNGTESTTSSSSSSTATKTRTTTCETPGWWGCLDKTTTASTTTTSTSTTTTTTCETPGWFGCKDPITTTVSSTQVASPAPSTTLTMTPSQSTSTCLTPGWFGHCKDVSSTQILPTSVSKHCETPGKFWGCRDRTPLIPTRHPITRAPEATPGLKEDM